MSIMPYVPFPTCTVNSTRVGSANLRSQRQGDQASLQKAIDAAIANPIDRYIRQSPSLSTDEVLEVGMWTGADLR